MRAAVMSTECLHCFISAARARSEEGYRFIVLLVLMAGVSIASLIPFAGPAIGFGITWCVHTHVQVYVDVST